jgi:transcriptional regulator with XRE-family HTH domain
MTMGERIVYLRNKKGISQVELARRANIKQSTLHGYESGARSAEGMSVARAMRLAEALGVELAYLCGRYEGEPMRPAPADKRDGAAAGAVGCSHCGSPLVMSVANG